MSFRGTRPVRNEFYKKGCQEKSSTPTGGRSEKLGLRLENAKIHYLLGSALRLSGDAADATAQYRETLHLLDDIRKEPGAEHVTERYDLKPIYGEATQFTSSHLILRQATSKCVQGRSLRRLILTPGCPYVVS